jgi:ribonuclease VapC
MVIDSSAVLAILLNEPELPAFTVLITHAKAVRLSAASYVEAAMVLEMRDRQAPKAMLDDFVREYGVRIEPVTEEQAVLAGDAFRTYGKGIHKARLNYGDCFTYALAKAMREPLLFKGNDFSQTDLESAIKPLQ